MAVKNRQPIRTYDDTYALASKPTDDLLHGEPPLHYDYSQVAAEHRADIIARAKNIKRHERRTVESMLIIGRDLIAVQEKLPHGHFLPWVEQEFGWQRSTAYNLINLATKFPTVGNLPPGIGLSALYQLTAAPDTALEEAQARQAAGESITKAKATEIANRHRAAARNVEPIAEPPPVHELTDTEATAIIWRAIKQHCPPTNADASQQHTARLHWLQNAPVQLFQALRPDDTDLTEPVLTDAIAAVTAELQEALGRHTRLKAHKSTALAVSTTGAGTPPAPTSKQNSRVAKLVLLHKLRLARPYLLEERETAQSALGYTTPLDELLHNLDKLMKSLEEGDGDVAGRQPPSSHHKGEI